MIPWLFTALYLLHNFNEFIVFDFKSPNCSFVDTDMTDESENENPSVTAEGITNCSRQRETVYT